MATDVLQIMKERAVRLAIMYLTRRSDVTVELGSEVDVIVGLPEKHGGARRQFGVVAKGSLFAREVHQHGEEFDISGVDLTSRSINGDPYPVCLFVFTMENDCGYWKWLLEPTQSSSGGARLVRNEDTALRRLGNSQIEDIVVMVNDWYAECLVAV